MVGLRAEAVNMGEIEGIRLSRRQCSVNRPIRIKALAVGRLSIDLTNAGGSCLIDIITMDIEIQWILLYYRRPRYT